MELYDDPANVFVATFIGAPSMNLITGQIVREDQRLGLRTDAGAFFPLNSGRLQHHVGEELIVGFRPEHVSVAACGETDTMVVRVMSVEPTGIETFVQMRNGAEAFSATFHERFYPEPGKPTSVKIDSDKIHIFDKSTGQKIG